MNKKQMELKAQFEAIKEKLEAVTGLELNISGSYIGDNYTNYMLVYYCVTNNSWYLMTEWELLEHYNVDKNNVFVNLNCDDEQMTFEEAMANIKEPFTWTLEWAKQELLNTFNWLKSDGFTLLYNYKVVMFSKGDVNTSQWHKGVLTGHPTFDFSEYGTERKLTMENYYEFKEVLQWYEDNVINIEKPWEDK